MEIKDGATFLSKKFEGFGPLDVVVDISTYLAVEDFDFDEFFLGKTTIKRKLSITKMEAPSFINSNDLYIR